MVSVTSEVMGKGSFQGAPARSARSDSGRAAGIDSFSGLVDCNTAAGSRDNRSSDTAGAKRRADDPKVASGNRSRDNAPAPDNKPRNDRETAGNVTDNADQDVNAEAGRRAKSKTVSPKSDAPKPDEVKPEAKSASGDSAATTDQTDAKPDGKTEVIANALAIAIPVPAATAETASASDKATAPLAIAAAAIAATATFTSAAEAGTGIVTGTRTGPGQSAGVSSSSGPSTGIGVSAGTGVGTSPTPMATTPAAKADSASIDAAAAVSEAVTVQAASTDTAVTSGITLAASAAAPSGPSKVATQPEAQTIANNSPAASDEQGGKASTAAAPTAPGSIVPAVTPKVEEVADKPKVENGIVDAAKADVADLSASTSSIKVVSIGHLPATDAGQPLANAPSNSLPAAGAFQTQPPANSNAPAPAPLLNVTAATNVAVPLSGLAMEIAASAHGGKSRFEIRLDPAELGRIDVRIDVDRNGRITSHLTVERPETLSMLRQDASQLQRALDNAGLSTGNSGLQFSLRDQSSQGQNDGNPSSPNAHRLIVSEEDSIPAVAAGRSYGRMLGSSSGVDIRV